MRRLPVSSFRGQLKIQEMAFVLLAFIAFFAIAGLFYFSLKIAGNKGEVQTQREDEAKELVRSIAESAEFRIENCKGCIDLDKAILFKDDSRKNYQELWNLEHLSLEIIYPKNEGECNSVNYPNCRKITIIEKDKNYNLQGAFASLCRWNGEKKERVCYLGKIFAGAKEIK